MLQGNMLNILFHVFCVDIIKFHSFIEQDQDQM